MNQTLQPSGPQPLPAAPRPSDLPDHVRNLYAYTPSSLLGNLIGSVVVVTLYLSFAPPLLLGSWALGFAIVWLYRAAIARRFAAIQLKPDTDFAVWQKRWNAGTLANTADKRNLSRYCEDDGFTTANSWGYRLRAVWDYPNAFLGVNLQPNLAWSHDVEGYSPGPGGNFEEDRKAISVGLNADYQNTYTMNLSYTDFFEGKYSTQDDRDFVALSFGVNF